MRIECEPRPVVRARVRRSVARVRINETVIRTRIVTATTNDPAGRHSTFYIFAESEQTPNKRGLSL